MFEKAMVDYHEGKADQMALYSMGPFSLCHCGYPDTFGACPSEKISHWVSIMVRKRPYSIH
jgi:hypothetical protein